MEKTDFEFLQKTELLKASTKTFGQQLFAKHFSCVKQLI